MKKLLLPLVLATSLGVSLLPAVAQAETTQEERAAHPRIAQACDDLEAAIQYMEAAPHDFGATRRRPCRPAVRPSSSCARR